jgi:LuxR family maltose regulon positive regulatory protein
MEQGRQQVDLKLRHSAAQRHIIKRPRLTKLLDEAEGRILLLIAPAGYGKTTLAREWLAQRGRRGLWYRARTGSSDVAVVARSLSKALAPLSSTIERSTRELLAALTTPEEEPDAIADLMAEELDGWPVGTWLVMDEYELVAPHAGPVRLVERLVQISGARVLITGRDRPSWIKPRDLLYGDAFELRAASLAMTLDEASQVLESATHAPAGLVALADGWPAVIGLAALLPGEVNPTTDVQSALFDYVAQELFDNLDPDVQRHLVLLSMPSALTPELVQSAVGNATERVLASSINAGLITVREGQDLEIHPLCRAFLQQKVWDIGVGKDRIDALAVWSLAASEWDDAFELISRFDLRERLPLLIERGLRTVLSDGRLAAVEKWVAWANEERLEGPELALARAEIYLRRGDWELSESLAVTCARMTSSPEMAAEAHLCAGSAAHLLDQADRAWEHYGKALGVNVAADIRRRALWGRFVGSYWTRRPDYRGALAELEATVDSSPDHFLRLGQAKLVVGEREGYTAEALAGAQAVEPLLSEVEDPFIRSGFLNSLSRALVLAARYDEAERTCRQLLDEVKRFHLTFALPSAQIILALARLGLGSFTTAAALIERSEREDETHDSVFRVERGITRACIALSRGAHLVALDELNGIRLEGARTDIVGEALAMRALTEACCGDAGSAKRTMVAAAPLAGDVSPRVLVAATVAILALADHGPDPHEPLNSLARTVMETGCFDGVICALRAHAALLEASKKNDAMADVIRIAASRSGDATLAVAVGSPRSTRRTQGTLTPREFEVLQLVEEGFHNDEIGRRLFISPKTAKTHLQNIYEKLNVNSRTEAVTKAKEAGLLC